MDETTKALHYILSPEQLRQVVTDERQLRHDLSSVIEEFAIVKPQLAGSNTIGANEGLELALRSDINQNVLSMLGEADNYSQEQEQAKFLENGDGHREEYNHQFMNMKQKANGFEFDEEIEELEESYPGGPPSQMMSAENFFLSVCLFMVVLLAIVLCITKKRRSSRSVDSQVTKYKSLSASFGQSAAMTL